MLRPTIRPVFVLVTTSKEIELDDAPVVVGSGDGCDVRVPSAASVHARITASTIEAIAPCRVGKVPLDAGERRRLVAGCSLEIGDEELRFEERESSSVTTRELALRAVASAEITKLLVVQGRTTGGEAALRDGVPIVVGRGGACDLDLGNDDAVSRFHVEIVRRDRDVFVRDLGSTAGTFLGRALLEPHRAVRWTRDRMMRIGTTVFGLSVPWWERPISDEPAVPTRSNVDDVSKVRYSSPVAASSSAVVAFVSEGEDASRALEKLPAVDANKARPSGAWVGYALVGVIVLVMAGGLFLLVVVLFA